MPADITILHVADASTDDVFSVAALNHVAIERANGLTSSILTLPPRRPETYSWRYKRLRRLFPRVFSPQPDASARIAFVYGADLLQPLRERLQGAAPADVTIVLEQNDERRNAASDRLRRCGWSGEAAVVSDRLAKPAGDEAPGEDWRIAISPGVSVQPSPAQPGVGLCYVGRPVSQADIRFVTRLMQACGLPAIVMADELDQPQFTQIGAGVVVMKRSQANWPKFFQRSALLALDRPPPPGATLRGPVGRALQQGRPVLCVGKSELPGVTAFSDEDALASALKELRDAGRLKAQIEKTAGSLSAEQGEKWHLERIAGLSSPTRRGTGASGRTPVGRLEKDDRIAERLVAATPQEAADWLATGPDPAAFRNALAHLASSKQGLVFAQLQIGIERLGDIVCAALPSAQWFQLKLFTAEWLLEENLAESALAILRSLQAGDRTTPVDRKDDLRQKQRLALALSQTGRQQEAEAVLRELIAKRDSGWWPRFHLARWLKDDHPVEALRLLDEAASLAPQPPPVMLVAERAHVLLRLDQGEEPRALLEAEAERRGEQRPLLLALANAQLACGDGEAWATTLLRLMRPEDRASVAIDHRPGLALLDRFKPVASATAVSQPSGVATVAVIMTAYNAEETVAAAMRSVLAQSYPNLRLVVVDDCSSDATLDVVNRIASQDPRVVVIRTARNEGTYSAKNLALMRIDADYYTFHDSDDWMHPHRISRHLRLMQERAALVCSYSSWVRLDPSGRVASAERENPASSFFGRSTLREVGAFDTLRVGADREFRDRLRRRYGEARVAFLEDTLGVGLKAGGSLTSAGPLGFDRYNFNGPRLRYKEAYWRWFLSLSSVDQLRLDFPQRNRSFPAPAEMTLRQTGYDQA
ncbi:MAG: hypothetical protein DI565_19565 [Ancylobacter novellus]|uniref:Glycosyltransferase 2-like domain-containing protein n=1 Tax=Ancylobacter novellus TaxID=921 RepID=A0A2W5K628_ANCNO|nr:MAG: hypothetical protein DI565_19565 [Ancylobacter novellus]